MENSKLELFVKKLSAILISPPKDLVGLRERSLNSPCYSSGQFIFVFVFSSGAAETQEINSVRFYFKEKKIFWVSCDSIKFYDEKYSFEDFSQMLYMLNCIKNYLL